MHNVYSLSDNLIQKRIGEKMKALRLRQNITQKSLAQAADISLSSVKKIEGGQIGTFESLLRCLLSSLVMTQIYLQPAPGSAE